ncbi:putative phosphoglycerate mutase [Neisseria perflava]|uniref:histidine phosphatase family protein n=1 Tax=Neisseria perflava TaxID=33053 RepID=UPI0020A0889C|nr:histidine phosphatase family protein [Neisseria perflava]MCP1771459.1 putative phosphoglycerate mutase [Neisseria perflava]
MALEVYLVRHGKTVFNTTGRLQGWSDSPLTAEGKAVAENLGKALNGNIRFDAAFCSVSPRAYQTAQLILQHQGQDDLPLQVVEEVREYCFGGFEGERVKNLHSLIAQERGYPDAAAWLEAYRHADRHLLAESVSRLDTLGLAENEAQFIGRLKKGMSIIAERSPAEGRVLLVSHGMSITGILKSIDPQSTLYQSVPNASVSRLQYNNGAWRILSVGEQYGK